MASNATGVVDIENPHPWSASGRGKVDASGLQAWVEARVARHEELIADMLAVIGARTAENTLRPYDDALFALSVAGSQSGLLNSVYPDKEIRDKAQDMTQKIAEAGTALSLNREVYRALSEVRLDGADDATRYFVERTLLQYRLAGVDKDDETRARIQALQEKAVLLSLTFQRNVQENVNTVVVEDQSELEGLPEDFLSSHLPGAGTITLTTDFPDYLPVMTFARSAALRTRMFLAYNTRAYPANRQVLLDLLTTRQEIAAILGFASWADLATADQMMESAANMQAFLDELDAVSRPGAEREYAMVKEFVSQREPGITELDASSRGYWLEQFRRSAFDFDSQSVRPYLPYERVQKGVLATAERLFHVKFERAAEADVWHESVSAWDVFDGERQVGRYYLDMHPREGKDKWFSAAPLIPGQRGRQYPEAALICNFPGGKDGDAGLMQHSDVVTYFHEFGHLMHAILGGQQEWAAMSGIATEVDFVEAPSQMLEEFFRDARLLASFATHYETGEPIPEELVARMNRAGAFGRADWVRTQLFYTSYALDVHNRRPEEVDPDNLLQTDYTRFLPYKWIDGNRMYASFTHLTGYSSNYYTYLFDKVIALDFFQQFDRANLADDPVAMRYRRAVLEPGGSKPARQLVVDFLGRAHKLDAFEKWVGEEFEAGEAVSR